MDEVIRRWGLGKLTVEQAIGQILLLLRELEARLRKVECNRDQQANGGRKHLN